MPPNEEAYLVARKIPPNLNSGGGQSGTRALTTSPEKEGLTYFSEVEIPSKFVFRVEPIPFTAVMITIEIPAAIRPYSIAVAPDSSDKNLRKARFNSASTRLRWVGPTTKTYVPLSK